MTIWYGEFSASPRMKKLRRLTFGQALELNESNFDNLLINDQKKPTGSDFEIDAPPPSLQDSQLDLNTLDPISQKLQGFSFDKSISPVEYANLKRFDGWIRNYQGAKKDQFVFHSLEALCRGLVSSVLRFAARDIEADRPFWTLLQWIFNIQFPGKSGLGIVGLDMTYSKDLFQLFGDLKKSIVDVIESMESNLHYATCNKNLLEEIRRTKILEGIKGELRYLVSALDSYIEALERVQITMSEAITLFKVYVD